MAVCPDIEPRLSAYVDDALPAEVLEIEKLHPVNANAREGLCSAKPS